MIPCFFYIPKSHHNFDARCRHRFSSHNDIFSRLVCDTPPPRSCDLQQCGVLRSKRGGVGMTDLVGHFLLVIVVSTSSWMTFWEVCIEFPVQIRRDLIFILLIAVSRRLPYDACVLSDLAVKSSGIRASSDLWNVELQHAQAQGKTLWLAQFHTARITNQTTEAIKTYIKATTSISIGRWSFPYFPTCVGVKCWFIFGYIFWYFPILKWKISSCQTWQDVGQGIERWSQVIAMCCLEKVSWCAVTVRVWAKRSETQYLNAFKFPCILLMHSEFQMVLLFLGCYVDYSKSLLWWEGMRKLLSFYVSPFLFKPAMYGISYARVYLSEVVLTVHRGRYSIRDWCFHQFFRSPTIKPSKFGSFKLFSWRIIIIYIRIYNIQIHLLFLMAPRSWCLCGLFSFSDFFGFLLTFVTLVFIPFLAMLI